MEEQSLQNDCKRHAHLYSNAHMSRFAMCRRREITHFSWDESHAWCLGWCPVEGSNLQSLSHSLCRSETARAVLLA